MILSSLFETVHISGCFRPRQFPAHFFRRFWLDVNPDRAYNIAREL